MGEEEGNREMNRLVQSSEKDPVQLWNYHGVTVLLQCLLLFQEYLMDLESAAAEVRGGWYKTCSALWCFTLGFSLSFVALMALALFVSFHHVFTPGTLP